MGESDSDVMLSRCIGLFRCMQNTCAYCRKVIRIHVHECAVHRRYALHVAITLASVICFNNYGYYIIINVKATKNLRFVSTFKEK